VAPIFTVDCEVKPEPFTVSVVSLLPALSDVGAMELMLGAGLLTVTVAEALRLVSAVLVAFTVTVLGEGGMAGAVYRPLTSIVPTVALPPAMLFTDQVTEFAPPVMVEVNCCVPPVSTPAEAGETLTTRSTVRFAPLDVPPPGAGVTTVTVKEPAVVNAAAGAIAVNCPAFT